MSLADALRDASMVIFAVPSHGLRAMLSSARPHLPRGVPIVSTVKGLERETLLRMSEVMAQEIDAAHPIVVLSGPSFAAEFARELPTRRRGRLDAARRRRAGAA